MVVKKLGVIKIGEWVDLWSTHAKEYIHAAFLHAPDDEASKKDTYLELPDATGRNLRAAIKEAEDTLFEYGYTHARIENGSIHWEHRLYSSRRRIAARIEAERREEERIADESAEKAQRVRDYRNTSRRVKRARSLAAEMADPTPRSIHRFFRAWKKVTGFGPGKDIAVRQELSPGKTALMQRMLSLAQQNGWTSGKAHDQTVSNRFKDILYVDTPEGQVSFHFLPGSLGDLPQYEGEWSGRHDTAQTLTRLFESVQQLPQAA